MLIGRQDSKIDEKGRIAFPKKFRNELGETLIISQGFEGSLIIVGKENWQLLTEGTIDKPITSKEARETQRFLLGSAEEVSLDAKGRFILPEHLKVFADIKKEVVCLGILRYVQLWDKDKWEKHNLNLVKNIEGIAQKLDKNEHS
jgi:MraZ protein